MKNETGIYLEICDATETRKTILKKTYIKPEILLELEKADIIILPNESFNGRELIAFPEETASLIDYIERNPEYGLIVGIPVSEEDYQELELHSNVVVLAGILVSFVLVPILNNLLSAYLYDVLRRYNQKELNAKIEITVEKNGETKKIKYNGPISKFKEAMNIAYDKMFE